MRSRPAMLRWISNLIPTQGKLKLRGRRTMPAPYSAWVDVLENRDLLSATIPFTINVPTTLANQGIYVAMYGSIASPVTNSTSLNVQYNIEWDASGNAQQVTNGGSVEVEQLNFTANTLTGISTATVYIPDIPNGNTALGIASNTYQLNGARLVFGVGHQPYLAVSTAGGVAAPAPSSLNDPNTAQNYDFVEFTLDQAGMHINTSTVDQFGFPITVSATPVTQIALGSNNVSLPLSNGTINVGSTAGFASQGQFQVMIGNSVQTITYTGTNGTQFLGCSGGTGTLLTGQTVWSVSTYITSNGVGVQLDREDVFNGFSTYVGSTSPFLSSLTSGNTASAGSIYLPALASNPLSAHSGSGAITVQVYNVSPNDPLLAVNFGNTPGTNLSATYDSTSKVTTITVTPPVMPVGTNTTVDVTVTSTGGTSPTYPNADYFQFGTGGTLTVTGLSATTGPILGGEKIIINGSNFTDPNLGSNSQLLFGTTPAPFTVLSTNQILAVVPNGVSAKTINVSLQINGQTAATTPSFQYLPYLPSVTGFAINNGTAGSSITVTGKNFVVGQTTVQFGGVAGTNVQVNSPTSLTVTAPAGSGTVDVTVTTDKGTSPVTPDDQFTYNALPAYSATQSLRLVNPSDILIIESNPPVTQYAKCEPGGTLTSGQMYYYQITATSNTGESIASNVQNAQANGIPGYNSVGLTWTPFLNATGYNVYRSTTGNAGSFQYLAHVNGGQSTAFLDDGTGILTSQVPPTNIYTYDPLASYFDQALISFFNYYAPTTSGGLGNTFSLNYGGITFSGTTTIEPSGLTYLSLTGSDGSAFQIYQPLFNTNTNNPSYPAPPAGLTNNYETPGQMVFSGDGVFALQTGTTGTDNANSLNVENVIVAAFNRGIATNFSISPSNWGTSPGSFYAAGSTSNFYAGYMHQSNVSISDARPASVGGPQPLAYGFSYDDQAGSGGNGYGSYFTTPAVQPTAGSPVPNGSFAITVNLGSWTSATSMKTVSPPTFNLTQRPLEFKVQLTDQNGAAVFQGGQAITLKVTGPWKQTTTYTLITAPDGTVTGTSTASGKPVEIIRPGNYTLTFSAGGLNLVTETLRVTPREAELKRRIVNARPPAEHNRWEPCRGLGGPNFQSMRPASPHRFGGGWR